ncbi:MULTISPECIES: sulfatase [unclassified Nocardioides]|uniref:sulfatase n=1 Tax=unclassified Nocardioides TaxID=2615069 RepID=UPI0007033F84|nr:MULTISPECIES: sulfatase [unclassified Nocardioides]KRC53270.1 hypothetical protein ASE19_13000 [Nocardioides sp. Root79]KRC70607.1 hypothetical protein ASE20_11845 [Nocardioides sp. Root240]
MTALTQPTRRTVLQGAGAGCAVALTTQGAPASAGALAQRRPLDRPNVIVVTIDDLGWRELGCYGNTFNETPQIDRLAREGTRFTQAYAAAPLCSPTRAALVTGRYPGRTGITDYLRGEEAASDLHLSTRFRSLPEVLAPRGYTTGHIGKWHLTETYHGRYRSRPGNPYAHGFDEVIASEQRYIGGGDYFHPYFFLPGLPARSPGEYLTDRLAQEATGFIRRHHGRPFFLHVANYAVHSDLRAKPGLLAKYRDKHGAGVDGARPVLAAMLESIDQQVGRIVRTLKDLGIARNTLLLVTSDNGGALRAANRPLRGGKGQLYEGGIRVPLVAWWPGTGAAGRVSAELASTIDVLPTAAGLAGADVPAGVDGIDLTGVIRGTATTDRDTLFWAYPHHIGSSHPHAAVRQGGYKLVRQLRNGRDELFDLVADPAETNDISRRAPDIHERLGGLLAGHLDELDLFAPPPGSADYPRAVSTGGFRRVAGAPLRRSVQTVGSARFALSLATAPLLAAGHRQLRLGVVQDADNHLVLRYSHRRRGLRWELRHRGRLVDAGAEPVRTLDGTVDLSRPGARLAMAVRGSQVTAYADEGSGRWEMLFRFDVGGVLDFGSRAVRSRYRYAATSGRGFRARLA